MGIDNLSTWMMRFGFGDLTGIDIFEESRANMPTREWKMARHRTPWYKGDTIPVGIGQGYWTATPMQLAKATSVVANKGKVIAPHLLRSTIKNGQPFSTQKETEYVTFPPLDEIDDKYWDIAIQGMYLVNHGSRGTARRAFQGLKYKSAGKSGTAQVFGLAEGQEYDADELAEHLRNHALYVGFAPIDHPKLIVSLVLENAGGGSGVAAPVVRRIFDHVILRPQEDKP